MGSATFQQPSYYRTPPLNVDTSCHGQKFFDDDEILDDDILNQSTLNSALEMSPPLTDSRRDSFAVSATALFSPKSDDSWPPVEMPSNNPFFGQHNNPFMQMDQNQQSGYQNHWGMMSSGAATPLQSFDGLPQAEYESSTVPLFRPSTVQAQTPFSNPSNQAVMFQQLGHHGIPAVPASPPRETWINQELKNQAAMAKRNRPTTPLIRSHNELRRGDGIRKKNARFDIPAERNLSNIDQLIAQSTDEQEIKELKQQKRLLRNRQAALDSRQRKKQHTERLEDEKKHFTEVITNMEEQMNALQREMEQLLREKQNYEAYISELKNEKEEIICKHTMETGELRKRIHVLTTHVQDLESAPTSTPPAGPNVSSFPGAYGEMEGMAMDGSWDNMPIFGEFTMDQQPSEVKQEMQIVPTKKSEVSLSAESEKAPSQGGLLFMLFLVGAFVLSNRSPPSIPRVSEDIRVASATLLENVLKDAGLPQAASGLEAMAPQPSGSSWAQNTGSSLPVAASGMDGVAPSMLGEMADALTQPTEQQTNEQLFGLTAAQYNGITSQDFLQNAPAERSTSKGRRNLAEALANMRAAATKDSAAEVYTRSLLWDKIPRDVVRDFAKMVAESQRVAASNEA